VHGHLLSVKKEISVRSSPITCEKCRAQNSS